MKINSDAYIEQNAHLIPNLDQKWQECNMMSEELFSAYETFAKNLDETLLHKFKYITEIQRQLLPLYLINKYIVGVAQGVKIAMDTLDIPS